MNKSILILAFLWSLSLSTLAANTTHRQVVEIGITGMVCEFCVASVEKNLKKLAGVKQVKVSLQDKRAEIIMADGKTIDEVRVRTIIEAAGFTPGKLQIH